MQRAHTVATKLKAKAREAFQQFRVLLRAFVHPEVPWYTKLVCGCAVLYVVSPIQLIPNFIPVIGQMDDVLIIGPSIKLFKRSPPQPALDSLDRPCKPAPPAMATAIPL